MEIVLKQLTMVNFRKERNRTIDFEGQETTISGDNGTGKSTVFDAFTFLLFGKDSHDRKDFEIKTLDSFGCAIPMLDHEVLGVVSVDGNPIELRRVYAEKWTKKRGSDSPEFTGHETTFFYNGVPLSQKDYQTKIDSICNETLFKLITNPLYFPSLKWNEQRSILFEIAGNITNADVAVTDPRLQELLSSLNGRSIDEHKAMIQAKKKKISDEIKLIPSRVDEVKRSIPEKDDSLFAKKQELEEVLHSLESQVKSATENNKAEEDKRRSIQNQISELANKQVSIINEEAKKRNDAYYKAEGQKAEIKGKLISLRGELNGHLSENDRLNARKLAVEKELERLREEFIKIQSDGLSLDDSQTICPVCKREFENSQEIRSEQIAKFNKDKSDKLDAINERGKKYKDELQGITEELVVVADRIKLTQEVVKTTEELEVSLHGIQFKQVIPEEISAWKELQAQIDELSSKSAYAPQDFSEKLSQINTVRSQISEVDSKLSIQSIISEREARVEELNDQLKTMAQELATLEKYEFLIQEFTKAKINMAESRINSLFEVVKFKLFNAQINGGETETCEISVNGVPFSDLNTAMKTYAGMDVINVISKFYKTSAPIFIDNRESITRIPKTNAQVINLLKVTGQKELSVEHAEVLNENLVTA